MNHFHLQFLRHYWVVFFFTGAHDAFNMKTQTFKVKCTDTLFVFILSSTEVKGQCVFGYFLISFNSNRTLIVPLIFYLH